MSILGTRFGSCRASLIVAAVGAILAGSGSLCRAEGLPAKTLVFCSDASPAGFDPAQYTTSVEYSAAAYTVYNRLVEFRRGGTEVEPGLAQSWDISPNGLVYTFHLRHGVKFQTTSFFTPARMFNADDVVLTFERMLDKDNPLRRAYPAQFPYFASLDLDKNIASIDRLDPYTVRITLKSVSAPFLSELAMPFASVISAEYASRLMAAGKASDLNQLPVGTGPFIFRHYTKDNSIRFDGNPDYWKPGTVRLNKLVFDITPDPAVRMQKLRAGECQMMNYPRPADIKSLQGDPTLRVSHQAGFNLAYLGYNTTHPPLDNVEVRRALDMAINKKAIIESVYEGAGQAAANPMPPTQWSYNAALKDAAYSPAKAKERLAKAGFPNGFDISLWAMSVQRPYNPNARLMAEMIQADWAKIGVRAKIVSYEWGEYVRRGHAGEHDAILTGFTGDNGDPDNWLRVLLGCSSLKGGNYAKWCYKPFDDLIVQAQQITDVSKRMRLYMRAQEIFKDQVPFTPIAYSNVYQPMRQNVVGFEIDPFGPTQFWNVGLK
ncbi:ABC transporter substrate-binding protein [Burkholderia sp. JSH-S8]|uniref:ABC transporter substrate-binding protein n=1 Tax=Burkholderia stagnalis TaxID=1503054 RepID=UPI000F80BB40|nr:ABC transporter substrate-binding protein [Burkholderia stagnalis]WGS44944.1 ABC transporter substrate-binding protein [Burkholderia sp. JSH-S8]